MCKFYNRVHPKKNTHIFTIIATRKIFLSMQYDASSRSIKESVCYQVGLIWPVVTIIVLSNNEVLGSRPSSTTTELSSVTLHEYRWQFYWQNIVFMNIYEAGETDLSSNEIACYNKILFNLNDVIVGLSYLK